MPWLLDGGSRVRRILLHLADAALHDPWSSVSLMLDRATMCADSRATAEQQIAELREDGESNRALSTSLGFDVVAPITAEER